jgi:hypothetical protein
MTQVHLTIMSAVFPLIREHFLVFVFHDIEVLSSTGEVFFRMSSRKVYLMFFSWLHWSYRLFRNSATGMDPSHTSLKETDYPSGISIELHGLVKVSLHKVIIFLFIYTVFFGKQATANSSPCLVGSGWSSASYMYYLKFFWKEVYLVFSSSHLFVCLFIYISMDSCIFILHFGL